LTNPPDYPEDILTLTAPFCTWIPSTTFTITNIVAQIQVNIVYTPPDSTTSGVYFNLMDSTSTTTILGGDTTQVSFDGVVQLYTFNIPGPADVVSGTTYTFLPGLDNPDMSATYNIWKNSASQNIGTITVYGVNYLGNPVTFYLSVGSTFKYMNQITGYQNCLMNSFTSQSFVSTLDTLDWIVVGETNPGATFS